MRQLGQLPSEVFDDVAVRLPDGPVPDLLREFGGRKDITLSAFGWQLVETAEGPDFMPAPYLSPPPREKAQIICYGALFTDGQPTTIAVHIGGYSRVISDAVVLALSNGHALQSLAATILDRPVL